MGEKVNIEREMVEFMKPLFGDMAEKTLLVQKDKLGFGLDPDLSSDDYLKVIKSIGNLCRAMAGEAIARKMEDGLSRIVAQSRAARGKA
jgi:hypothetical protein